MNVFVTCKYEEDLIKNEGARVLTTFSQLLILWIRKFSRDFYFAIFSFSNYSRVLKFASKHSCSRPFPWV